MAARALRKGSFFQAELLPSKGRPIVLLLLLLSVIRVHHGVLDQVNNSPWSLVDATKRGHAVRYIRLTYLIIEFFLS